MGRQILITNDDGIDADGIRRLAYAAGKFGEVYVVAPHDQRSAASHSITLRKAFEIHPFDMGIPGVHGFSCTGTPADCIRVGKLNVMPKFPDVVLTGINYGYNVAADIQYSATLGAAFEAEFQGIPAIAFSEHFGDEHEVTDRYLVEILGELIDKEYVPGQVWNVNFPGCSLADCKGILWDRKVSRMSFFDDRYKVEEQLPDGGMLVSVDGVYNPKKDEGTDYGAILSNYVSVGIVRNIS
ncbi:MAG: 5'/3'-nucleotidase SurE [Butyrivibrio sp.]|nr:5'/3'-nucleotidase SurE [Butyrivibrio sp.]